MAVSAGVLFYVVLYFTSETGVGHRYVPARPHEPGWAAGAGRVVE
jgi:hypothetical protein